VVTTKHTVQIAHRFRGPARSGNGGYSAGLLGTALSAAGGDGVPVRVTLRKPPPLDTDLSLEVEDGAGEPAAAARLRATLSGPGGVVAEAEVVDPGVLADADPGAVRVERALVAEAAYQGLADHPFPGCFTCGPANQDGLRLRPGPDGDGRSACTWTPADDLAGADGLVDPLYVWAALDCPGGWSADIAGRPMVLGRLTAAIDERPKPGQTCVVVGRLLGAEGRKTSTVASLYGPDGQLLSRARHTWIEVDPAAFE
jgi:hypothetical protein